MFLDTNILLDIKANRKQFSRWAIRIFKDAKSGKFTLYTSSLSILICNNILEKQTGIKTAKRVLKILLNRLKIKDVRKKELLTALTVKINDYEDAVQHECAKLIDEIDYIITRNKKDFKMSIIKVLISEELYLKD